MIFNKIFSGKSFKNRFYSISIFLLLMLFMSTCLFVLHLITQNPLKNKNFAQPPEYFTEVKNEDYIVTMPKEYVDKKDLMIMKVYKNPSDSLIDSYKHLIGNPVDSENLVLYTKFNSRIVKNLSKLFPENYEIIFPRLYSNDTHVYGNPDELYLPKNSSNWVVYDPSIPDRFYIFNMVTMATYTYENQSNLLNGMPWQATFRILEGPGYFSIYDNSKSISANIDFYNTRVDLLNEYIEIENPETIQSDDNVVSFLNFSYPKDVDGKYDFNKLSIKTLSYKYAVNGDFVSIHPELYPEDSEKFLIHKDEIILDSSNYGKLISFITPVYIENQLPDSQGKGFLTSTNYTRGDVHIPEARLNIGNSHYLGPKVTDILLSQNRNILLIRKAQNDEKIYEIGVFEFKNDILNTDNVFLNSWIGYFEPVKSDKEYLLTNDIFISNISDSDFQVDTYLCKGLRYDARYGRSDLPNYYKICCDRMYIVTEIGTELKSSTGNCQ